MATPLDSADQEQVDDLKYFWKSYGTLITSLLLLAAVAYAGWTGWQYMQRSKVAQSAALYDEIDRGAQAGEMDRVQKSFEQMKEKFAATSYAQQAGLAVAKVQHENGNQEASRAALGWVAEHAVDPAYQALAKLRLSGELMDAKSYDEALKQLTGSFPKEFEPLVFDRKGDIFVVQGKRDEAQAEYKKALAAFGPTDGYRRLVEVKLNAVGVDPTTLTASAANAASAAKATP